MPTPLPTETAPADNRAPAVARLLRQIAALEVENAKLRKALAEERRCLDIALAIDRIGSRAH